MKLTHEVVALRTKNPFVIARGGESEYRVVRITVTDRDGAWGWGEAAPSKFYGETADTVVQVLPLLAAAIEGMDGWSLEAMEHALARAIRFNGAARAGVSAALHDLAGKRLGVPVYRLWGLDPAASPASSFTIGIAPDEDTLRARVADAAPYPVLKLKLGSNWDERIVRVVRELAPDKVLRVDANAGWTPKSAKACASCASGRRCRSLPTRAASYRATSRSWPAWWTASTSSWPSAAACGKRCAWWPPRARMTCW